MTRIAILVAALASGCGSDSVAPSASVKTATPDQLVPADDELDDLTITIDYDDGDGDLGGGVAQVHDCRADGLVTELPIPQIAPSSVVEDGTRITGELVLRVNDIGALPAAAMPPACADLGVAALAVDQAVFCVILVDAAGHDGDGDCTRPIALAP